MRVLLSLEAIKSGAKLHGGLVTFQRERQYIVQEQSETVLVSFLCLYKNRFVFIC